MHPVLLQIGSLRLPSYGFFCGLGFLIIVGGTLWRAWRRGWDPEIFLDCFLVGFVVGMVLARLLYVWTYPAEFQGNLLRILQVWQGGHTFYGGLVGCFLGGAAYCVRNGYPVGEVADCFAPFLALGHGVARLGCYLGGCCYGAPTALAWAVTFPQDPHGLPRHPTQLYESGLEIVNFLVLDQLWRRGYRGGRVFLAWLVLYAPQRLVLETLRGDNLSESFLLGSSLGQTIAVLMLLGAGVLAWLRPEYGPEDLARLDMPGD